MFYLITVSLQKTHKIFEFSNINIEKIEFLHIAVRPVVPGCAMADKLTLFQPGGQIMPT